MWFSEYVTVMYFTTAIVIWGIRSSGALRRNRFVLTDVSGQPVSPTFGEKIRHIEPCRWDLIRCPETLVKARLHGCPRLINAVESLKLNSKFERYCLHSSTKVNEAVDFKMVANELVPGGFVVIFNEIMSTDFGKKK